MNTTARFISPFEDDLPAGACERCGGVGIYLRRPRPGEYVPGHKLDTNGRFPVVCELCGDTSGPARELERMSMLSGDDLKITFADYWERIHGSAPLEKAKARLRINGFLVFSGNYGAGKSHMLKAIVNEARTAGRLAVYTTLPNLLDKLRRSMRPDSPDNIDDLWDNLLTCSVLALDEIDKTYETPWAAERLQLLAESRYNDWTDKLTVWALNDWGKLPGYLKSRLLDTQRSTTVAMQQRDLRRQAGQP
jgi:hypothetical protein